MDRAEPAERTLAEALAHGIADEQRAGQHGAGDGGADEDAEMGARVKPKAAEDEGAKGHYLERSAAVSKTSRSRFEVRACGRFPGIEGTSFVLRLVFDTAALRSLFENGQRDKNEFRRNPFRV